MVTAALTAAVTIVVTKQKQNDQEQDPGAAAVAAATAEQIADTHNSLTSFPQDADAVAGFFAPLSFPVYVVSVLAVTKDFEER